MKAAVQFDVDGVLADFVKGFLRLACQTGLYAGEVFGDTENPQYGTHHIVGRDADAVVWQVIRRDPSFWYGLPRHLDVTRATFDRINAMQDDRDVYFVTNRIGLHPRWQTIEWLELWGVKKPTVVVSDKKGEFARAAKVGYSIEDKAGNAVYLAYESVSTTSCLIDRPYNRFPGEVLGSKVRRVSTVDEFLDVIESEGR